MSTKLVLAIAGLSIAGVALTACAGIKDHVRSKDFRETASAEPRATGIPSPVANVPDMSGWTTDIDAAVAFATENPQKTVLFVQQSGAPQTESIKQILTSAEAEKALADKQKVTLNMLTSADIVGRYGITQGPAVVLLGPGGIPESQKAGNLSKSELLSYIK